MLLLSSSSFLYNFRTILLPKQSRPILEDQAGSVNMIDYILFGKTRKEHDIHMQEVPFRLEKAGIIFNKNN